ncbi:MAG: MetQ/NlpA family ABC transporter substrate-binding protein [Thermotaleaceae bacterium]
MKKILSLCLSLVLLGAFLTGCGSKPTSSTDTAPLKVGVTAGPHEQIMEKVKELAKEQGLEIQLTVFSDYVQPNVHLFEKQLDVNSFQHQPYLDKFNADQKMDLLSIATTVNFPMGVYSEKIGSLSDLKTGDKVSLPNDPTNGARALILLESAGVIKLKEGIGVAATLKDVVENPLNIELIELEAPMVARSLPDVRAAVINTNFAIEAGFNPVKDSIFIEPKDSPWVNVIAVRPDTKDDERIKKLVEIYQSDAVKAFIDETFDGSVIAGF